ncbi:MAG: polyketide synthase, partial [Polyangiaceae bacterium]|nr:polyketide synthase [Polyangiaceae bacterium]
MSNAESGKKRTPSIAVVGMACRFPGGADSPAAFWDLLSQGVDAVVDVPPDRWSLKRFYDPDPARAGKTCVRKGGFLQGPIDAFDCHFFGISPREAAPLDPQQRLLLEVVWEALEDAGQNAYKLRGSNTGAFIGAFTLDHKVSQFGVLNRENIGPHTPISSTMAMLANRISYCYDFRGPSVTLDTACSSSLVALHMACQGLLAGECDIAVTGGVNVMTRPEFSIAMSKG